MALDQNENPVDRRTPLAILICVIIFMAWQKFYLEPRTQTQHSTPSATQTAGAPSTNTGAQTATLTPAPGGAAPRELVSKTLTTGTGQVAVSSGARFLSDWNLVGYHTGISNETGAVNLASVTRQAGALALKFDDPQLAYLSDDSLRGSFAETPQGLVWTYDDANVRLTREYSAVPNQPALAVRITAEFKTRTPAHALVSVSGESSKDDPEAQDRQLLYFTNASIDRVQIKEDISRKEVATPVKYIGASNRYFVLALLNESPLEPRALIESAGPYQGRASLVYPVTGKSLTVPLKVFFGPKEIRLLRSVDPALDNTVDLGWFTVIAYPLLNLLKLFYSWFKNYGIAIIVLTVLIKIVLYPLTYKSMKSMKEMARVQPQLAKLREKYKDDKEALNREMMTLMKSHGYNPAAGCLPILIQMPVFFALYRVLYSSIELYHAPFFFWIRDLSAKDPLFVTPVLLTVTMFVQQKLSPQTATDPAQQRMMQFMPIMFGVFMVALPSGLTLYMLVNAIASIGQQAYLNKKLK